MSCLTFHLDIPKDISSKEMPLNYPRDSGWRVASEWSKFGFCFCPSEEMAALFLCQKCRPSLQPDVRPLSVVNYTSKWSARSTGSLGSRDPRGNVPPGADDISDVPAHIQELSDKSENFGRGVQGHFAI